MKNLIAMVVLLLAVLVSPSIVSAEAGYTFTDVDVNGIDMAGSPVIYAERDGIVQVKVDLEASEDVEGIKVKTWLGGYEYGEVKAVTELFDVEAGVTYPVILAFEIPSDIDASKEYTLHIEAYDKDNSYEEEYVLRVKEKRHSLEIQDVIFNPGLTVENTEPLFVEVRVENMGDKKEEDIKVEVSIPSLGIAQRTYIDELVKADDDDDESSETSDSLYLDLSDVEPGVYKVLVTVEYNRGHDITGREYNLVVEEGDESADGSELIVAVSENSQMVSEGEEVVYSVSLANLGENHVALTPELVGASDWANANVQPNLVVVSSGSSAEFLVTLTPKEDTQGTHQFLVNLVNGDGEVVEQVALEAVVRGKASSGAWSSIKTGLEIAFIVLLIVAVILAVVLGIQKASRGSEDSEDEDSLAPEPATYY